MATVTYSKQLSQRLIPTTASTVIYTIPNAFTTTHVKSILVCNTTNATKTYSIYLNPNGTVAADQFALWKNITIASNATDNYNFPGINDGPILSGANAAIIVNASVANTVTFNLFGIEVVQT